jgi:outer membrane protein assembly factor BamB
MKPPPTGIRAPMSLAAYGAVDWSPIATDPRPRSAFSLSSPWSLTCQTDQPKPAAASEPDSEGAPERASDGTPQGRLVAVDHDTGKIKWQAWTAQPMIGGVLATAGDLVFAGEANGHFKPSEASSGQVLWKFKAGAGVNARLRPFRWRTSNISSSPQVGTHWLIPNVGPPSSPSALSEPVFLTGPRSRNQKVLDVKLRATGHLTRGNQLSGAEIMLDKQERTI